MNQQYNRSVLLSIFSFNLIISYHNISNYIETVFFYSIRTYASFANCFFEEGDNVFADYPTTIETFGPPHQVTFCQPVLDQRETEGKA